MPATPRSSNRTRHDTSTVTEPPRWNCAVFVVVVQSQGFPAAIARAAASAVAGAVAGVGVSAAERAAAAAIAFTSIFTAAARPQKMVNIVSRISAGVTNTAISAVTDP
jgi:hypothetical protein